MDQLTSCRGLGIAEVQSKSGIRVEVVVNEDMGSLRLLYGLNERCIAQAAWLVVIEVKEEVSFIDCSKALFFSVRIDQKLIKVGKPAEVALTTVWAEYTIGSCVGEDDDIAMAEYELAQLLYALYRPLVFTHITVYEDCGSPML